MSTGRNLRYPPIPDLVAFVLPDVESPVVSIGENPPSVGPEEASVESNCVAAYFSDLCVVDPDPCSFIWLPDHHTLVSRGGEQGHRLMVFAVELCCWLPVDSVDPVVVAQQQGFKDHREPFGLGCLHGDLDDMGLCAQLGS